MDAAQIRETLERAGVGFGEPDLQMLNPKDLVLAYLSALTRIEGLETALTRIRDRTIDADDTVWFSEIETLHDFCEAAMSPDPPPPPA